MLAYDDKNVRIYAVTKILNTKKESHQQVRKFKKIKIEQVNLTVLRSTTY